ncbi:MAG: methionyl-tRNA formyltransferase [Bacilli bacterium]
MNVEDIKITKEPKIIFMGTPEFAVPVLRKLTENYKIKAVITQPDRLKGCDGQKIFSPVKKEAFEHTLLVVQPDSIKEEYEDILALEPDLIITCAYGQILPKEIIEYPSLGVVNVHASLLPKLRGAAPIHRAIIEGYNKTGITLMYSDTKMDEGDIIYQASLSISTLDTASSLHDKLSLLSAKVLIEQLPQILAGNAKGSKQNNEDATYAFTIKRNDERLDFSKTKREIYNQIRGLNSWPGAYCLYEGKILKIFASYQTNEYFSKLFNGQITNIYQDGFGVKVDNGEIVITSVQPEGKRKMTALEFINGEQNKGEIIGKILD